MENKENIESKTETLKGTSVYKIGKSTVTVHYTVVNFNKEKHQRMFAEKLAEYYNEFVKNGGKW